MSQHSDTGIQGGSLLDDLADGVGAALYALGHDDHEVGTAGQTGPADGLQQVGFIVHRVLRDDHGSSAAGHAHGEGQMARPVAHDLHHGTALVRLHGVP